MVMKRLAWIAIVVSAVVGCNKPEEEDCKKAIENMRKLMGTDSYVTDLAPHIRRCKGGSSKEAVACAIKATSRAELEACGFAKFDEKPAGSAK
jgi:hypothetical protein